MSQPQHSGAPAKNPMASAVANAIRHNPELKLRQGNLAVNGSTNKKVDFFRFKRVIRALLSEDYKKKQMKSPILPLIDDNQKATAVYVQMIQAGLVYPLNKLKHDEAVSKKLSCEKGYPNIERLMKATLDPNEYYFWNYEVPNPYGFLYGILMIVAVFGLILFPLWPYSLRLGVWYLSMGSLGLLFAFFVMAIIRLILFLFSYPILSPGFWLFPNLFADCGFFESFVPLYGWGNEVLDPKSAKLQERKKLIAAKKAKRQAKASEEPKAEVIKEVKGATGRKVHLEEVDE